MEMKNDVKRLDWTRELAEQYWQGAYDANLKWLSQASVPERHLVYAISRHTPKDAEVTLFLERDDTLDLALQFAGYSTNRINAGPRNRSTSVNTIATIPACDASQEFVIATDALAQLLDDEIEAFFQTVRSSLKDGGRVCLTVPNNEVLDQHSAIDPLSGVMYHKRQRLRSFTPETLEALVTSFGFEVQILQQLEFSDTGFASVSSVDTVLANTARAHIGNGETLFLIAGKLSRGDKENSDIATTWVDVITQARIQAGQRPEPAQITWSNEVIERFWSYVANTPLDDLSFGVVNRSSFLQAVSPWLSERWRYLDFGAGDGFLAELMLHHGFSVATLEPAAQRREVLNRKLEKLPRYLGTVEKLESMEPFDCVVATEVIEHISNDSLSDFMRAIWKALAPGGLLLLSTPHGEDLEESEMYSPISGAIYHRWQHLQSWSVARLKDVLTNEGFEILGMHDVDFSAIQSRSSPYADLLLARAQFATVGKGGTLLCVARRSSVEAVPLHPPHFGHREFPANDTCPETGTGSKDDAKHGTTSEAASAPTLVRHGNHIATAIDALRVIGRMLPSPVKRRLAPLAARIEDFQLSTTNNARTIPLKDFAPLISEESFHPHKILQVNNALAWGGVERQVVTLMRALEKRGYPADLLCLRLGESQDNDFYRPALEGYPGAIRNAMHHDGAKQVLQELLPEQRERIIDVLRWLPLDVKHEIERFVAEFLILRPYVVHAWQDGVSLAAGYAAQIVGVPRIIVSSRNLNPTNFGYFRPYMREGYRQLAACPNIEMVNNSEAGAVDYASWLGIETHRFEVHRNGVDPGVFAKAAPDQIKTLRTELGIPDTARVVGSLFRFYPEKNPLLWAEMALRIANERSDVHFVIFGVGPMKDEIREFASRHRFSERLHLPGTIQTPNLALGLFDVFVLTSRFEGTPNVIIEASMLGIPVVTTSAGGAAETVEPEQTGFVEYEWKADGIASRVLTILGDPSWHPRTRLRGPAFIAERFGLDRMVDEAMTYYGLSTDRKPF